MGKWRQSDADYTSAPVWENFDDEYGRAFFSVRYAGRKDLFKNFFVWKDEAYRALQGTYPVISLSFAKVKATDYVDVRKQIIDMLVDLYSDYSFLLEEEIMEATDKEYFKRVSYNMDDVDAAIALHKLSKYLYRYYGKK